MACRVLMTFGSEARAAVPALIAIAREEWSDSTVVDRQILALDRLAIQAMSKIAAQDRVGRPGHRGLDRAHSREVPESFRGGGHGPG